MYEEIIKPLLSEKRFKHCLNVAKSAEQLAKKYGADAEKARVAGTLHDIMKEKTQEEQLEMVDKFGINITKFEMASKKLFHAITGSAYIEKVLGINDEDIINAVRYHTTAREGMSLLEKVIFVADFISEDRDYKGVEEMRKAAARGLDNAVMEGLKFTVKDLADDGKPIHPNTLKAYNEMALKKENSKKAVNPEELSNKIYCILDNKKAININVTNIGDVSSLADYFIFASGTSTTHVKSLAEEVKFKLKEEGVSPSRKESDDTGSWVLLDYGSVIVHIFTTEMRQFYNIEGLWNEEIRKQKD